MADDGRLTPRLRSVLDEIGVSLSDDELRRCADTSWVWSIHDAAGMEPAMFEEVELGKAAIKAADYAANRSARGVAVEAPEASASRERKPAPDLFVPRKVRRAAHEIGQAPVGASGEQSESKSNEFWATRIFEHMGAEGRARFLPGGDRMPQSKHDELVLDSIRRAAEHGTLRNCAYALDRLDVWLARHFTACHGFGATPAETAWFFRDACIGADEHVPQQLVSGLRMAANTFQFPVEVAEASVKSLCRASKKTPKQAPSASVRVVYHFWQVASNTSLSSGLRAMSAAFLIMCLAALRGVDAQRSSFDELHRAANGYAFFSAIAYNSKSGGSMAWACPIALFGGDETWFECFMAVWASRDFMFPSVDRGARLDSACEFLDEPASAYMMLRYLKEILAMGPLFMGGEALQRLRRHSFRHWIANAARVLANALKFSSTDLFQAGRWKEGGIMPLRYAQETQFLLAVDIIVRVLEACQAALALVPASEWPYFGGWELLMPARSAHVAIPDRFCEPEAGEASGEDSSDDDSVVTVKAPVVVRTALPPGWSQEEQVLSSGRVILRFRHTSGAHTRSKVGAWRLHDDDVGAKVTPLGRVPTATPRVQVGLGVSGPSAFGCQCVGICDCVANACGIPGCMVPGAPGAKHGGICVFEVPRPRRRRSDTYLE